MAVLEKRLEKHIDLLLDRYPQLRAAGQEITDAYAEKLRAADAVRGDALARNLERALMAIPLVAHEAMTTAYINDVDGLGVFAQ